MSDVTELIDKKIEECTGCIGFTDEHTCEGWADFQELKASINECQNCKRLQSRIELLEAMLDGDDSGCEYEDTSATETGLNPQCDSDVSALSDDSVEDKKGPVYSYCQSCLTHHYEPCVSGDVEPLNPDAAAEDKDVCCCIVCCCGRSLLAAVDDKKWVDVTEQIKRLRQLENVYKSRFKGEPEAGAAFGDAADTIERQRSRIKLLETVRGAAKALRGRFHSRPDIPEFAALDDALAAVKDKDDGWATVTVAPHSSLEVAARQLVECDDLGHIGPSAWSRLRKALSMTKAQ